LRRGIYGWHYRGFLAVVVPEVELAPHEKEERVLERKDEGAAVELEEGECGRKPYHNENERTSDIDRQNAPEDVASAEASANVDKLPEGQRPEYLVLYFDKLRDLKLHIDCL